MLLLLSLIVVFLKNTITSCTHIGVLSYFIHKAKNNVVHFFHIQTAMLEKWTKTKLFKIMTKTKVTFLVLRLDVMPQTNDILSETGCFAIRYDTKTFVVFD